MFDSSNDLLDREEEMNNDLISRDAVIKSIQNKFNEFDFDTDYNEGLRDGYLNAIYAIEDAPTVNYPFYQEAYQTGYEEGKNEKPLCKAKDEAICEEMTTDGHCNCSEPCPNKDERPQGEWIENNYGKIQCSICKGFAISIMTGCLMDRHLEQYKTKFCPWCGADMQKGGAE